MNELYEIEEYCLNKLNNIEVDKIKNTYNALKVNQAFCVPKKVCGHVTIKKILIDAFNKKEVKIKAVGDKIFTKNYTATRIIKVK